jgi:proteasome lid subunit RPN8/RPN11
LLVGSQGVVDRFVAVPNADPSPTTFLLDPVAHHRALLEAEAEGRELVGVVHSHPASAAVPSETDLAGALEPEWAYVIVGRLDSDPEVRAWWIVDGVVGEIPMVGDALVPGSP